MSISSEITRLQEAKEDIIDAIEGKGVTVPTGAHYDDFPDLIDAIPQGGSGNPQALKSVTYTPSEAAIADEVTPDSGYDSIKKVNVSVGAVPSNYVGTSVPRKSSSDLTASGATVTAPSGYYASNATKTIPNASQALTDAYVHSSGDLEVELNTSSGGYVANGNQYLQFEDFTTPVPTTTYYATSSDQVIMSQNSMAFGAQTIKGVTYTNLTAENIKKDVVVEVGDSADPDRIVSVTGTYEGGGGSGWSADQIALRAISGAITLDNSTTSVEAHAFSGCSSITSFSGTGVTSLKSNCFQNCSGVTSFYLPNANIGAWESRVFQGCTSIVKLALPSQGSLYGWNFRDCTSLQELDLGSNCNSINGTETFMNDAALVVIVLRRTSVVTLSGTGAFNNTPFKNGGTGGTIYIPESLYNALGSGTNDYKAASNWSTIDGYGTITWKKIEGSYYETNYADGTAV